LTHRNIHSSSLVVNHACPFVNPGMNDAYIEKLRAGGITLAMSSVAHNHSFRGAVDQITAFYRRFEDDDRIMFVTEVEDVFAAKKEGRIGVGFHFQNSRPVEHDLALLDVFCRLGVRVIQLTYNEKNLVGDGCTERTDCGLSEFGLNMIKRMNKLGMLVDLSHVGYRTSMEAMEVSEAPVIFSHSNANSVCPSKRNLKDDQIKALAEKKGVIGMNAFPAFVKRENPCLEDLLDHIDCIAGLVGVDHIGLGFDFAQESIEEYKAFGYDPDTYPLPPWTYPRDIEDVSKTPNLTEGLLGRGYAEGDIKKILGENFIRVFKEVWK
ncbi:MAG: dipeptidase, partial [Candidatus Aminicenantes bacterium]|nr:dipeptidase [Candidatus Aminicenantes bacterium]